MFSPQHDHSKFSSFLIPVLLVILFSCFWSLSLSPISAWSKGFDLMVIEEWPSGIRGKLFSSLNDQLPNRKRIWPVEAICASSHTVLPFQGHDTGSWWTWWMDSVQRSPGELLALMNRLMQMIFNCYFVGCRVFCVGPHGGRHSSSLDLI